MANESPKKGTETLQEEEQRETPSRRLVDILGKDNVVSSWLTMRQGGDPEVFIALADKLSVTDRAALTKITDATIGLRDDLLKRLTELEAENAQLRSLSLKDDLTGLYNYRYFSSQLNKEIQVCKRTGRPFSLIMIDIDNFKTINDTIGHNPANNVMVEISNAIKKNARPSDIGCRYGGDEFALIVPATYMIDALRIAERFNDELTKISWSEGEYISASIGLAEYDPESDDTFEDLINIADKALYKAKEMGKGKIFYFEPEKGIIESEMVTNEEKRALYLNLKNIR